MALSLIAAVGKNGVLGKNNDLLWHLPLDFKFFKETTQGHAIVMGRKTFESLGRPLPNRENIVVTTQKELKLEGCTVFHNLDEAIEYALKKDPDTFVIGGAQIYKLVLPLVSTMYLTEVDFETEGDAFFPEFPKEDWFVKTEKAYPADDRHKYAFTIKEYNKK
jgi:dihydrofolate reductase